MAKIGDFAIAKFDNGEFDERDRPLGYEEVPCLIVARSNREFEIIHWTTTEGGRTTVYRDSLPSNRLKTVGFNLASLNPRFDPDDIDIESLLSAMSRPRK